MYVSTGIKIKVINNSVQTFVYQFPNIHLFHFNDAQNGVYLWMIISFLIYMMENKCWSNTKTLSPIVILSGQKASVQS